MGNIPVVIKPKKPPISIYSSVEQATKEAVSKLLPLQISIQGVDVKHNRQILRPENEVYGKAGGTPKTGQLRYLGMEKILMTGSHWRFIDGNESGYLEQPGWMYCMFDLWNGDLLTVKRNADKREISFVASQVQEIGNTVTIVKRFLMSNIDGS